MAKNKIYSIVMVLLLSLMIVGLPASAQTVDPSVEFLKINGDEVNPASGVILEVDRGEELDVRIGLRALNQPFVDGFVEATIVGYEHGFLRDEEGPFDIDVGEEKRFSLNIELPSDMDRDRYDLRVLIFDRTGATREFRFPLDIDTARHHVEIENIEFNPGSVIEAGRSLLTTVRMENRGEQDEEVLVRIEIPGIGQASDFIDELDEDETTTSEELFIRVPQCAEPGTYTAKVSVLFNDDRDTVTATRPIEVVDGGLCQERMEEMENEVVERTSIAIGSTGTERAEGGRATFPVTLTNDGSQTRTYTLMAEGADEWSSVEIAPSNVMSLRAGETATAFVYVMPEKAGEHVMTLRVASGDRTLEQIPLKVVAPEKKSSGLSKVLTVVLIVIIVVVILIALVVAFRKSGEDREEDDDDEMSDDSEGTTYY